MLIIPAIDLRGGKCVRLRQGDYARETVFGEDPTEMARGWVAQGSTFLHLVDLDGAKQGQPVNSDAVARIVQATGVRCQLGGGLREETHLEHAFSLGVARVILGTRAIEDPAWCEAMCRRWPGKVALGIDARNGKVAVAGWLQESEVLAVDLAARCAGWPLAAIIYTDISRDGMLQGPNLTATVEVARAVPRVPVIASGGVTTLENVAALARAGLPGCIIGRALYEGAIDLAQAIAIAQTEGRTDKH